MLIEKLRSIALASLALGTLGLAAGACSVSDSTTDASQDDALSASSRSYVSIRHDTRKCAAPTCGGYFVHDLNRQTAETYVSKLNFANAPDLDADTIDLVTSAPDGEIVLRGKLGTVETKHHTRPFLVYEAYRGAPDHAAASGDVFFNVTTNNPLHECFTAPCNNEVAHQLNSTKTTSYTRTDANLGGFIEADWLANRVENGGAIVVGSFQPGDVESGGAEKVLKASEVYLRLPEVAGPCPAQPAIECGGGKVNSYTRDDNRCDVFAGCVNQGPCPQFLPGCGADYDLVSWRGANGCSQYACDPSWLSQ